MASETSENESGAKQAVGTIMTSRPVRAFQRFGKARGMLLAGGIAYTALFSIVAALTIAWTIFSMVLGDDQELQGQVIEAVNEVLPGILDDGTNDGMIPPDQLIMDNLLNPASIIAFLVLLWSAIGLMSNIRSTVQAMFGMVAPAENFVLAKLRDLMGFIAMALGIVLSAMLGTAAGQMGQTVLDWIGLGESPVIGVLLRVVAYLVAAAVAAVTFAFLFRVTAAVRPPAKDLWLGSFIGGIGVQIVLFLGTSIVSVASDDPLLAASASLATLLLFVNLLSQVLLIVSAFTANPPSPQTPQSPEEVHFRETPNFVTLSAPHTLDWEYQDVTGQLDVDEDLRPGVKKAKSRDGGPVDSDVRPDGEPIDATPLGVLEKRRLVRRSRKYERELVEMRAKLGQRPRVRAAEEKYWNDRGVAGRYKKKQN
ncbi:MAG: YihY/virulence factor BrkB family protein [Mobilicoccus sp.]|nr:YihY/virulence factor BrkB family protein [Mobilicoccus sp.]